nr:MAG TPA: TraM-like-terminal domain of transfer protein TraM [Crassvirales sp.]
MDYDTHLITHFRRYFLLAYYTNVDDFSSDCVQIN